MREYFFPATFFCILEPNCSNSFLGFVNIVQGRPSKQTKKKNVKLRERISMFTSTYRLICRKNGQKTAKIPMLGGEMAIEK